MDAVVPDIFGYHALQLGMPPIHALQANRMPHQWLALQGGEDAGQGLHQPDVWADFAALPFPASSLDLVVLPHTLELSTDAHATLREVERVLVPDGKVVISGFNPTSLWGLRQRRAHFYKRLGWEHGFLPEAGEFLGYWRLRDWLRLLGFEMEWVQFGCYRPAFQSEAWLQRMGWMDKAGARWWPILGAAYCVVATKRVRGMRLLGPAWKKAAVRTRAAVAASNRSKQ